MENLLLSEVATALGITFCGNEIETANISTNSAEIRQGDLFLALVGENFDGNHYVEDALGKGACYAIASDPNFKGNPKVWVVKNTRLAYLQIAGLYRSQFDCPVVAITGSVGKTTTKEMVSAVLESQYTTLKTEKNLNNEVGLSQMLLRLDSSFGAAVLELGVDGPEQMLPMSLAVQPTVCIVTNIGESHLEAFGTRENIYKEKLKITTGMKDNGILLLNGDNDFLKNHTDSRLRVLHFGIDNFACDILAKEIVFHEKHTTFTIAYKGKEYLAKAPVIGKHNVYNALAGFSAGVAVGIPAEQAVAALQNYSTSGMRQNIVEWGNVTIVEDCYNASPDSMKAAIDTLSSMQTTGRKIAVLSDMLELGVTENTEHYNIGTFVAKSRADVLLLAGTRSKNIYQGAKEAEMKQVFYFEDQDNLFDWIKEHMAPKDILWFKASRGMRLEYVIERIYKECK